MGYDFEQIPRMYWDRVASIFGIGILIACLPLDGILRGLSNRLSAVRQRGAFAMFSARTVPSASSTSAEISHATIDTADIGVNGAVVSIHAAEDLLLTGLKIAGDLGQVFVFAQRDATPFPLTTRVRTIGKEPKTPAFLDPRYAPGDWRDWVAVGHEVLAPAWNPEDPAVLKLRTPVPMRAGMYRYFYVRCTPLEDAPASMPSWTWRGVRSYRHPLLACTHTSTNIFGHPGSPRFNQQSALTFLHALVHERDVNLLIDRAAQDLKEMVGATFCGSLVYTPASAAPGIFDAATHAFDSRLSSLDQMIPYVGFCNRLLINTWNGTGHISRHRTLRLPVAPASPFNWSAGGLSSLEKLMGVAAGGRESGGGGVFHEPNAVLQALWLRYLGTEAWAARLHIAIAAARECTHDETIARLLRAVKCQLADELAAAVECYVAVSSGSGRGEGGAAVVAGVLAANASLSSSVTAAERLLVTRLSPFGTSAEGRSYARLRQARPSSVTLHSFRLLRLYGRGSYGDVYSAQKLDTGALFALKLAPLGRVTRKRAEVHLRMERQTAERCAGCPFLCELRYAFCAGPYVVLALPLLPGGTLQVHIEERAKPRGGLSLEEVRWIGAQLVLALEALHDLRVLHRDVKPSNVLLRHNGYLALTDFGLCADLPPRHGVSPSSESMAGVILPTSKAGTRGYWAPEVIQKAPQEEAADFWSLGVLLALSATGAHPFHSRWLVRGGEDDRRLQQAAVAPPDVVYARGPADDQLIGALEEALSSNALASKSLAALGQPGGADLPLQEQQQQPVLDGEVAEEADATTPIQQTPSTPASPAEQRTMTEEGMNFNTLHMPIEGTALAEQSHSPLLTALLRALLTRESSARLGGVGCGALVRAHDFFANVEWDLLLQQRLPPPYLPDTNVVYAKDHIVPISQDEKEIRFRREQEQLGQAVSTAAVTASAALLDWDFVSGEFAFAEELADCARKVTSVTELVKAPMGMPPAAGAAV